ncbi:MAG: hypothetical protein CVV05_00925 [Gammaproteobacteria bacterium HGW-Gammaproteobacteria-1]|jgi:hypothetical protein|nr:MAG: hypothetical protein CVV05_00925 [Gammaproteobacteria bacterium HGW-Gammaproteobacteria-1]
MVMTKSKLDAPRTGVSYRAADEIRADEHTPERAARLLFSAIIWQAYMDLTSDNIQYKTEAIFYFHSDIFEGHAIAANLDPHAMRQKMVRKGTLPPTLPKANPASR